MSLKQKLEALGRIQTKKAQITHELISAGSEGFQELVDKVKEQHDYLAEHNSFHYALKVESHRKGRTALVGIILYGYPKGGRSTASWTGVEGPKAVLEVTGVAIYTKLPYSLRDANEYVLDTLLTVKAIVALPKADNKNAVKVFNPKMKYYGHTSLRKDFYAVAGDNGEFKVNQGPTENVDGVWLPRVPRLRFAQMLTEGKKEGTYDIKTIQHQVAPCCDGTLSVLDSRNGVHYTCPRCTGKLKMKKLPLNV